MDREKLRAIREGLVENAEEGIMERLSKNDSYFAYFVFLEDVIRNTISALLEDDKPKSEVEGLKRYPGRRYMWSPKEIEAIQKSIIHWRGNVSRLKLADELGLGITLSPVWATWLAMMPWGVGKKAASFSSKDCALCNLFYESCKDCPLSKIGDVCVEKHSTYRKCGEAKGNEEIIEAAENMVKVLESLLE